jgi:hypothetical protein
MTSMRYRDAELTRAEHARTRPPNQGVARTTTTGRRLPPLQSAAVPNDVRSIRTRPSAPRTHHVLKRARRLGRGPTRPRGRHGG